MEIPWGLCVDGNFFHGNPGSTIVQWCSPNNNIVLLASYSAVPKRAFNVNYIRLITNSPINSSKKISCKMRLAIKSESTTLINSLYRRAFKMLFPKTLFAFQAPWV